MHRKLRTTQKFHQKLTDNFLTQKGKNHNILSGSNNYSQLLNN